MDCVQRLLLLASDWFDLSVPTGDLRQ